MDLATVADSQGIARQYVDITNRCVTIPAANREAVLAVMGYPTGDETELRSRLRREELKPYLEMLDPVTVWRDGERRDLYLRTRADLPADAVVTWTITREDGGRITATLPLEELEIADYLTVQGTEYDRRRFRFDGDLPYGYHAFRCEITAGARTYASITMALIRTPRRGYVPPALTSGRRLWGVSVQLYALRSRRNWGVGDFSDLRLLLREVARRGGDFVGVNPLHAGYPANPDPDAVSPYSPASRQWLNVIYIDVTEVPEYIHCPQALALVRSPEFRRQLQTVRAGEYVDYRNVLALKLRVLRIIFRTMRVTDERTARGKLFRQFVRDGGTSLQDFATYGAVQAAQYADGTNAWGWPAFPLQLQQAQSQAAADWRAAHRDEILFQCYLQFLAAEQWAAADAAAREQGMAVGTYRDLAVGVGPGSCDVWADREGVYCTAGSLGAPPDPLGPLGQSWGLAPMNPQRLRTAAYRPVIELYRRNMQACGALRIDHAAGLNRLWVVRQGQPAAAGAYVACDLHDLTGIIALESQRHRCMIIAEDLGTIPPELRAELRELGAYSYKLFFGERRADGGFVRPQDYFPQAMAALTTHDMPTLTGWWAGADLSLGERLGLYTAAEAGRLTRDRETAKTRILEALHASGAADDAVPRTAALVPRMTPALAQSLQVHMCRSACALYSAQLEDWIGEDRPVNVPGTFREYPNWRRKLQRDLEDLFADPAVTAVTQAMTRARAADVA